MSIAVQISDTLVNEARILSKAENRSITDQIEHWVKIGKIAEENPTLPFNLIQEILNGVQELENGQGTEYEFG